MFNDTDSTKKGTHRDPLAQRQRSGSSCGTIQIRIHLRQVWRGGTEIPMGPKDNGTVQHRK